MLPLCNLLSLPVSCDHFLFILKGHDVIYARSLFYILAFGFLCLSLREFAEKTLEKLRKKLRQKVTKNATKSAE